MNLYDEFSTIVRGFRRRRLRFAVVGGLAMAFHDEPRFTRDIDVLLHSADEGRLADAMTKLGYFESSPPWRFGSTPIVLRRFVKVDGEEFVPVDVLVSQAGSIDAMVERAPEHRWSTGKVRVVTKEDLIALKKGRGSDQDKVDIGKLRR